METKELKIPAPEGYEIDKENSTFECIKFKLIKKDITYEDICVKLFNTGYSKKGDRGYFIGNRGDIEDAFGFTIKEKTEKNNAINKKQLKRILALNQLLNIAEYYNRLHTMIDKQYVILYDEISQNYTINPVSPCYRFGVDAVFNRGEDAQAVIDNPNFREILDTIYK